MTKTFQLILLLLFVFSSLSAYSQENTAVERNLETLEPEEELTIKERGSFHFFVENKLIFAFSAPDTGFGFGGTLNIQYNLPINLSVGLETGYYGFRTELDIDNSVIIGGYTMLPLYAMASYNFRLVENFYIAPVLKFGGAYVNARINGWLGSDTFSMAFEGGVRIKAYMRGGLLIHGGVMYTGLIEKSGLFSIMTIGFGFGI